MFSLLLEMLCQSCFQLHFFQNGVFGGLKTNYFAKADTLNNTLHSILNSNTKIEVHLEF